MEISVGLWIGLIVSVALALVIMIVAFVTMRIKINKIKKEALEDLAQLDLPSSAALNRPDSGELLWELKAKTSQPLGDEALEFLINTAIRNKYATFFVMHPKSEYEQKSLRQIAQMKLVASTARADLTIIVATTQVVADVTTSIGLLKSGQMVVVVHAVRRNKNIKALLKHLQDAKIKHDFVSLNDGIIMIVK